MYSQAAACSRALRRVFFLSRKPAGLLPRLYARVFFGSRKPAGLLPRATRPGPRLRTAGVSFLSARVRSLADNDSYTLFDRLGDLIRTGPTNTNVNDLYLLLTF